MLRRALFFIVVPKPLVVFLVLDLHEAILHQDHENALHLANGEKHVHVGEEGTKDQAA